MKSEAGSKERILDTLRAANEALGMTKHLVQGGARQNFVNAVMQEVNWLIVLLESRNEESNP